MDLEFFKPLEELSFKSVPEILDFMKFAKVILTTPTGFIDTSTLLREIKIDNMESHLLPRQEDFKNVYSLDAILSLCKKNDLHHLLNLSAEVLLNYLLLEVKSPDCEIDLDRINNIISHLEMFQEERTCFTNEVVCFVESLISVLDGNCTKGLNKKTIQENACIKNTIIKLMEFQKVPQLVIRRAAMKIANFIAQTQAYLENPSENFCATEHFAIYLTLVERALRNKNSPEQLFDMDPGIKMEIKYLVNHLKTMLTCPCTYLNQMSRICLTQLEKYGEFL